MRHNAKQFDDLKTARVTEVRCGYTGTGAIDRNLMRRADISSIQISSTANATNGKPLPFPVTPVPFA
jgi:aspartate 1-decarboxylase